MKKSELKRIIKEEIHINNHSRAIFEERGGQFRHEYFIKEVISHEKKLLKKYAIKIIFWQIEDDTGNFLIKITGAPSKSKFIFDTLVSKHPIQVWFAYLNISGAHSTYRFIIK